MFTVIKNIAVPKAATTRTRAKGEFHQAVDALEVGDGFLYNAEGKLKSQYPKVSPKKFPNKSFKIWEHRDDEGNIVVGTYGVKRLADGEATGDEAAAAEAEAEGLEGEGEEGTGEGAELS